MTNFSHASPNTLSFDDAVISFILKHKGAKTCTIARRLGSSPTLVNDVLLGDVHPTASNEAMALLFV